MTARTPLRIGILGAARIARGFVAGVRESETVLVSAVASRDQDRGRRFASEHGVPQVFGSYDALLASDEIDAIYNPLPNSLHAPWSIRAMEAGKHVLCEKPLAVSRHEAITMFDAARRAAAASVWWRPIRTARSHRRSSLSVCCVTASLAVFAPSTRRSGSR